MVGSGPENRRGVTAYRVRFSGSPPNTEGWPSGLWQLFAKQQGLKGSTGSNPVPSLISGGLVKWSSYETVDLKSRAGRFATLHCSPKHPGFNSRIHRHNMGP